MCFKLRISRDRWGLSFKDDTIFFKIKQLDDVSKKIQFKHIHLESLAKYAIVPMVEANNQPRKKTLINITIMDFKSVKTTEVNVHTQFHRRVNILQQLLVKTRNCHII